MTLAQVSFAWFSDALTLCGTWARRTRAWIWRLCWYIHCPSRAPEQRFLHYPGGSKLPKYCSNSKKTIVDPTVCVCVSCLEPQGMNMRDVPVIGNLSVVSHLRRAKEATSASMKSWARPHLNCALLFFHTPGFQIAQSRSCFHITVSKVGIICIFGE